MNQTAFYKETIGLIDDRRSVTIVYLDLINVFDTVSHKILIQNLMRTRDGSHRKLKDRSILHVRKGCETWVSREQKLRESYEYVQISDRSV